MRLRSILRVNNNITTRLLPVYRTCQRRTITIAARTTINRNRMATATANDTTSSAAAAAAAPLSTLSAAAGANSSDVVTASSGPMHSHISSVLRTALNPIHFELKNESSSHSVPKGSESHFKVVVVSSKFDGLSIVDRHRIIHELLAVELRTKIHALSITAKSPAQWNNNSSVPASPACLGGSKHDNKTKS